MWGNHSPVHHRTCLRHCGILPLAYQCWRPSRHPPVHQHKCWALLGHAANYAEPSTSPRPPHKAKSHRGQPCLQACPQKLTPIQKGRGLIESKQRHSRAYGSGGQRGTQPSLLGGYLLRPFSKTGKQNWHPNTKKSKQRFGVKWLIWRNMFQTKEQDIPLEREGNKWR